MTATALRSGLFLCDVCDLLNRKGEGGLRCCCARCGATLHGRTPNSLPRTWAFLVAAAVLYVPANLLPVMHTGTLFNQQTDTIMSGVVHLWVTGSWGLAIIVFIASMVVPLAKLLSLGYLAWAAQRRSTVGVQKRADLYRATHYIGRWSMVDIYVGATLVDYAGGRLPAPSLARSLRAVIEGETAACRDVAVCEFRGHTAVVDSDWKLEVDPDGEPVLLFDRRRDPAEQEDVLGDARHAGVVAALRERLAEHVAATPAPRERVATVER